LDGGGGGSSSCSRSSSSSRGEGDYDGGGGDDDHDDDDDDEQSIICNELEKTPYKWLYSIPSGKRTELRKLENSGNQNPWNPRAEKKRVSLK
jgi:hypothetical protein